jgi:hypothetical protein
LRSFSRNGFLWSPKVGVSFILSRDDVHVFYSDV